MKNYIDKIGSLFRDGLERFLPQIFAFNFPLPKANFPLSIFILLITLSACNQQQEHDHAAEQAAGITYTCPMHPQIVEKEPGTCPICGMDLVAVKTGGGSSPELMLSESQILLANIKTKKVGLSSGNNVTVLTGRVRENEELTEVVSSRVSGRIERLYVKETGRQIQQGQALYDIYSEELLTYQQEYLLALEQYEQLGDQTPRYASFVESARRRLQLYGMTDAQIRQLAARRNTDPRVTFLSPVSGLVTNISALEGQYVQEGSRLLTISRLDPVWVEAELYQQDLDKVRKGMKVRVLVEGLSQAVEGTVTFVSPEFRASSQIVNLRVEVPNPNGELVPGMQANILLPITGAEEAGEEVIVVPVDAVVRDQKGAHVWIRRGENTFEPRKVLTADATAEQVIITEGLQPGEEVVSSGAYLLYSEFVLKKGGDPITALEANAGSSGDAVGEQAERVSPAGEDPVLKDEPFAVAFAHYLEVKEALVASDAEKAQEQADALQTALQDISEAKEAAQYASRIAGTSILEEQRQFFFFLNNNFIKIAEQQDLLSGEIYVQYCPMANNGQGAYWLSVEEEIRNPYLPENMLSCGEVKNVIK